jgi:O-methyltransferase
VLIGQLARQLGQLARQLGQRRGRPGGLLLVDNAFWGGEVVGFGRVMYVREFNDLAAADPRVDLALTPVADGLLVACPKVLAGPATGTTDRSAKKIFTAG